MVRCCAAAPATAQRTARKLGRDAGQHHFFGYYNKSTWDKSGRYVLAQRTPFKDVRLTPQAEAEVGFFDLTDGDRFHVVRQRETVAELYAGEALLP